MMNHEHLSFDGWRRLVEELLKGKVRRWLDLLRCPECRRRLRQLLALREPQAEQQVSSWDEIRDHFRMELARASEDAARAEGVLRKFLDASDLQRNLWLTNSTLRGNLALCQKVLRRANEEVVNSPIQARNLSILGFELTRWVEEEDEPGFRARLWEDCKAEAWLVKSRVHLWLGNFQEALESLRIAKQCGAAGSGDPLSEARILRIRSCIFLDLGRFGEAAAAVEDAARVYRSIGDLDGEVWCRMGRANMALEAGHPRQGLWHLYKARQVLGSEISKKQSLFLRHNEVANLCQLHEFTRAARVFKSLEPLYEEFPELGFQVRRDWLSGRLAAGFWRFQEATSIYEETRRSLLETWGEYDAATLALDFGQQYVELGRTREATRVLEQALPVLRARSLPQVSKAEELLAEAARRARDRHTPTN